MTTTLAPDELGILRASAGRACALLKVLGNEDRLMLLCQLAQGERNVGELERLCGIRQPSLSQQLGVLREEGLVQARREGKFIHYRIASQPAMEVMATLSRLFCEPASG